MLGWLRSRCRSARRTAERGAMGAFVAVIAPALIGLLGLVYDGGLALEGRQRALDAAEQAARAAANQCDVFILRTQSDCQISPAMQGIAAEKAQAYMGNGVSMASPLRVENGNHTVVVQVQVEVDTLFLGLFGLNRFTITLPERRATAVTGLA
jgi:Flp pilus assembly protein TadG